LGGTDDFEPEHEPHIHHLGQDSVGEVLYADVAGGSGDLRVGESGNDVAQSFAVDGRIAVHRDDDVVLRHQHSLVERVLLALVAGEVDGDDPAGILGGGALDPLEGVILRAVVDGDDFDLARRIVGFKEAVQGFGDVSAFVIGGHDHRASGQFLVREGGRGLVAERVDRHIEHVEEGHPRDGEKCPTQSRRNGIGIEGVGVEQRCGKHQYSEDNPQRNRNQ